MGTKNQNQIPDTGNWKPDFPESRFFARFSNDCTGYPKQEKCEKECEKEGFREFL